MSVRRDRDGFILLEGDCPLEDAEVLLRELGATPQAPVRWDACEQAHTAAIQVLLACGAKLKGSPQGEFLRERVEPAIRAALARVDARGPKGR